MLQKILPITCSIILSTLLIQDFAYAKNNVNLDVPKGKISIAIKTKNADIFIPEDVMNDLVGKSWELAQKVACNFKKHPTLFTLLLAALCGGKLYAQELATMRQQVFDLMYQNREITLAAGLLSLGVIYAKRKSLCNFFLKDSQDSLDENTSEQDKEHDDFSFFTFSKSSVRIYQPGEIKTCFDDVAGLETAKEELADVLLFLQDASQFATIGAKVPKGILLSGSPGNGKTLLAKALAGEAQCPFLYVSGSEFVQTFVGVGAARMRSLFEIARKLAPCILFIDEIDTIGRRRGGCGSGDTELVQTLNQLLVEMDGFEQEANPIIVIGATNRSDILDAALVRPGRFDRKIEIGFPFIKDRCAILQVHLRNVQASSDIDVMKIARGTPGYSGAELALLINEAAILALRDGSSEVTMLYIDQARDNINLGRETKGMEISEHELWQTAVHEAGHALAHVFQSYAEPLHKVTIVPRGGALGLTFSMPRESYSKFIEHFKAHIVVCLAGSVAEEIMYGGRGVGACSDLKVARKLATQMVMCYGMTEEFKDITFESYIDAEIHLPDALATKLQKAVADIIHDCRKVAYDILVQHKKQLELLVDWLLEYGTVYGSDVYRLCGVQEPNIEYTLS